MSPLIPGSRLGPYEILALIGAGGMGEVWKARDTRLDRVVAIKVAQEKFSERFEREARTVAALNHPHICSLYDVGPDYLVMEYIEGRPLEGPLPLDQVLKYAAQICDALDAAHKKHIVHRDLKPGNILVTKSGVKLLDFGLAKTSSADAGDDDVQTAPVTQDGVVLGTLQYMSPEQLDGKKADARSDIYSLGLVLYEMVTGKRSFPHTDLEPLQPPALGRVVKTCLAKDPDVRWQTAREVKLGLEWSTESQTSAGAGKTVVNKPWFKRASWIIAAMVLLAILVLTQFWRGTAPVSGDIIRFTVDAPKNAVFNGPVNATVGQPLFELSPDGRALVFAATVVGAKPMLWLRSLAEIEARALPGTEDGEYPFWSPDSEWVGFFAEGKLKKVRAAGGPVQFVADVRDPRGGSWGSDGTIIFGTGTESIYRLAPGGRTATPLTVLDSSAQEGSHRWPYFLPGGNHFLFTVRGSQLGRRGVYAASLDGKVKKLLISGDDTKAVYVAAGFLLFMDGGALSAQAFDAERLELGRERFTIVDGIGRGSNGHAAFSASLGGALAFARPNLNLGRLTSFDRSGKQLEPVGPEGDYTDLRLSPDEKRLAASLVDLKTGNPDIWLIDLERGGSPSRFTSGPALNAAPTWSPNGSQIVFRTTRNGGQVEFYQKSSAGAGKEEPLLVADRQLATGLQANNGGHPDWSPDGQNILYTVRDSSSFELWLLSIADRKLTRQMTAPFRGMHANFSPDGKFVSYASNKSGVRTEVYVRTFPLTDREEKISSMGGYEPRWRADTRELYYLSEDRKLMAVSVGPGLSFGVPETLFQTKVAAGVHGFRTHYVPSRDGKRFLINTQTGDPSPIPITVVLNWTAGLKP